ncbi:membrane-bound alpha-1,6- mannosyltransferase Initiation-specific [Tulasnella sp. JGI-2019a]|nr:membrane-bound alpha-1,6- mannosyltransferase Initiation-specific [Tulasnella sp. JGI-2019a]
MFLATKEAGLPFPAESAMAARFYKRSQRWKALSFFCYVIANGLFVLWYAGVSYTKVTGWSSESVVTTTSPISPSSIPPIPSPATKSPLSNLGLSADEAYTLGSTDLSEYKSSLKDFIHTHFPSKLQKALIQGVEQYLPQNGRSTRDLPAMTDYKTGWQTDKSKRLVGLSWRHHNARWNWDMLGDAEANDWVNKHFGGSLIKEVWDSLPVVILKADMLRYLLLLVHGGVYTDIDTTCLRSITHWGKNAVLWKDGKDWLIPSRRGETLESMRKNLGPPSVIIGVEADVGDRPDWHDWWARPLQIVQWTMASAPSHPIMLDVISRIAQSSEGLPAWTAERSANLTKLRIHGQVEAAEKLANVLPWADPKAGGHRSVMEWTGPGVFTDAAFRYLNTRYGLTWPVLRNLRAPLRVGDVVILPVTGFSPGVQQFGAQEVEDEQAMVFHAFSGSWKGKALGWKGSS